MHKVAPVQSPVMTAFDFPETPDFHENHQHRYHTLTSSCFLSPADLTLGICVFDPPADFCAFFRGLPPPGLQLQNENMSTKKLVKMFCLNSAEEQ